MRRQALLCALTMLVAASVTLLAQAIPSEQIQVGPPLRHTQAPLASATPQELEQRGDELRGRKSYLDALDYYGSALKKQPSSSLLNKIGITQLELQRFHEASQSFDRANFDYVMAKLFAQAGNSDRSLQYLRKALEEGYKGIDAVYKDAEFAGLRKDPRFAELMAARPPAIPE